MVASSALLKQCRMQWCSAVHCSGARCNVQGAVVQWCYGARCSGEVVQCAGRRNAPQRAVCSTMQPKVGNSKYAIQEETSHFKGSKMGYKTEFSRSIQIPSTTLDISLKGSINQASYCTFLPPLLLGMRVKLCGSSFVLSGGTLEFCCPSGPGWQAGWCYTALLHSGCTPPHAWSSSTAHISARIHRWTMTIFENVTKTGMFCIYFFF